MINVVISGHLVSSCISSQLLQLPLLAILMKRYCIKYVQILLNKVLLFLYRCISNEVKSKSKRLNFEDTSSCIKQNFHSINFQSSLDQRRKGRSGLKLCIRFQENEKILNLLQTQSRCPCLHLNSTTLQGNSITQQSLPRNRYKQ